MIPCYFYWNTTICKLGWYFPAKISLTWQIVYITARWFIETDRWLMGSKHTNHGVHWLIHQAIFNVSIAFLHLPTTPPSSLSPQFNPLPRFSNYTIDSNFVFLNVLVRVHPHVFIDQLSVLCWQWIQLSLKLMKHLFLDCCNEETRSKYMKLISHGIQFSDEDFMFVFITKIQNFPSGSFS